MKTYFRFLKFYYKLEKNLGKLSIGVFFVLLAQTIILISFQICYKEIFDAASLRKDFGAILIWIYVILSASVLRIFVGMLSDYLIGLGTFKIFSRIRYHLFHYLQWLPISFYQDIQKGDLVSRYSHDLELSEMVTSRMLPGLIRGVLLGVLSAGILFYFNWKLALFAICLFPFVIIGAKLFTARAMNATKTNQLINAKLSSMIDEVATQHQLIQAFNLQDTFFKRFQRVIEDCKKNFLSGMMTRGSVSRTSIFGLSISEILVFSVGAMMTFHGMMTIGTLFGFFALIWNLSAGVNIIAQYMPSFIEAGVSMERIKALYKEKFEVDPTKEEKKKTLPLMKKAIHFENVSLDLSRDLSVLKNINLEIPVGRSMAFVGPTGSGKSSLLAMIMGFYYPTSGSLLFDGNEIKQVSLSSLRSQIGVVFQQNPLFNTSIRENIRMGKPTADDREVEEAAKAAEIHDCIMSLPLKYETPILEYGSNLSVGQKQRIAIARVYLRNPQLILLDEPTSALDLITESQINALIARLAKEKTVILATHRLTALQYFDHICVIKEGSIVEQGSHDGLLAKKNLYYRLWQKQHGVVLEETGRKLKIEIGFLKHIPLLSTLTDDLLLQLSEEFFTECTNANHVVFEKGNVGNKFYIIARGTVVISDPQCDQANRKRTILQDGDYFGETGLLQEVVHDVQIKTLTPCIFLVLHSSQFLKILGCNPRLKNRPLA